MHKIHRTLLQPRVILYDIGRNTFINVVDTYFQYNLSTEVIAAVFLALSGTFTIAAPVWGYISNQRVTATFIPVLVVQPKALQLLTYAACW